jgi:AraC family transcriptional regulator of adaptative response/methylated-DNA-[protein]-cysteine methyltransferase
MERRIRFAVTDTDLGPMLVAASERGVCRVAFGDDPAALETRLREELPYARIERAEAPLAPWVEELRDYVAGRSSRLRIPIDVAGSRFRVRVWEALAAIPRGETRSYSDVARAIGAPRAARAVAAACAANPVAVAIPCHRVVEAGGGLGGYHYGPWRKRALLEHEGALAPDAASFASGAGSWTLALG